MKNQLLLIGLLSSVLFLYQNCSDTKFKKNDSSSGKGIDVQGSTAAGDFSLGDITANEGDSVALTVFHTGNQSASFNYVWSKNGFEIQDGPSDTLNINSVSIIDQGIYFVEIYSGDNLVDEVSASLVVITHDHSFTLADLSVKEGDKAQFYIDAHNDTFGYTYKWMKGSEELQSGADDKYVIAATTPEDQGRYTVKAYYNGQIVKQISAYLSVSANPPPPKKCEPIAGNIWIGEDIPEGVESQIFYRKISRNGMTCREWRRTDVYQCRNTKWELVKRGRRIITSDGCN